MPTGNSPAPAAAPSRSPDSSRHSPVMYATAEGLPNWPLAGSPPQPAPTAAGGSQHYADVRVSLFVLRPGPRLPCLRLGRGRSPALDIRRSCTRRRSGTGTGPLRAARLSLRQRLPAVANSMPMYEYGCSCCGRNYEQLRRMQDADRELVCPACGSGRR